MNTANLKKVAPRARTEFIASIKARTTEFGITAKGHAESTTAFVLAQPHLPTHQGAYFRLVDGNSEAEKAAMFKETLA